MEWLLYPLLAFLLGSIPFGRIIGRAAARIDVQEVGSRNIGATNVAREVGLGWGVMTLVLDALKGAAPVLVVVAMGAEPVGLAEVCGLAAVAGHQFSPFLRFHGGKGVATALGVFLAMEPIACGVALAAFVVVVAVSDAVSLGSMTAACCIPLYLVLSGGSTERIAVSAAVAGLILLAHRENIGRLLRGEERRWRKDRRAQPRRSRSRSSSSSE
ncbi:MAG: glycerol-3-phosphate 1-O-acyltransferase PlsY [Deltaproteobacteria bacterium]|nr:glycerol-3-phosphate 1-O-acyltransferase PlsY [Deltaproteobacteria bacterium]